MLPLNPLYEVVPVTKETMPAPGMHLVIVKNNLTCEVYNDAMELSDFGWLVDHEDNEYQEVTHYLRPLPPERMEEWVNSNRIIKKTLAIINGTLDGLELDNTCDVVEKSDYTETLNELKTLLDTITIYR